MKKTFAALAVLGLIASPVMAQNATGPVKARIGEMNVLAMSLGALGAMAKGEVAYSAEAATAAANSILGVAMIHQQPLWPAGTDEMSIDGTRAKAEIWDKWDAFAADWTALGTAAEAMKVAAATGAEAIGPALGQLGGTCKSCHEAFRAPAK